ncbi:MAG: AAA family ATPase [Patescibacteria group bacterium]
MLFAKNNPLNILTCPTCKGTGRINNFTCASCKGMGMVMISQGRFWYYGEPLTRYHIWLRRARKVLNIFRLAGALVFGLGMIGLFFWGLSSKKIIGRIFDTKFWLSGGLTEKTMFWIGIAAMIYLWYRSLASADEPESIIPVDNVVNPRPEENSVTDWTEIKRARRNRKINIALNFTPSAKVGLEKSFLFAARHRHEQLGTVDLFYVLLDSTDVRGIFIRLGITPKLLKSKVAELISRGQSSKEPELSPDVQQVIFGAFEMARVLRDSRVRETELLLVAVKQSEPLQEILYDLNVDSQKLQNVIEWVRIRERLREQYFRFRKAAAKRSKYGLDRAMTAVATPFLNSFSQDLTMAAKFGRLSPCIARDKEIDEIFRIIEGGRQSVVLVGERGVGKMSIIEGIAQRMVEETVPERIKDKRLVQLSNSALLAGTSVSGAQERLIKIMNEVAHAKNIILYIHNLNELVGVSDSHGQGMDVTETLAEYLGPGKFLTLATTVPDGYNRHIVNSGVGKVLAKVDIKEMDVNQAIQVLESKVGGVEFKNNIFFSYDAIESCVSLAKRFLHDQNLPESAMAIMSEVAGFTRQTKGQDQLVTKDDVATIIGQKTGIPATTITLDESAKLMKLEEEMHKRVVGQAEAVTAVAGSLRRARAEIRSDNRPIANFLFLGPTGVGKTELAKTIAEVYFGGENRMIRVDMSEYQDKSGIYRLIGQPGQQGTGLLTEAVRQNPFSLVLLDELEKADPDILNLFLQVFDDARLTDSVGRVIDFTNTIIIATSNAGTAFVQDQLKKGVELSVIKEHLMREELRQYYRPEFLNRFDGVVLFRPLNREEIKQIAGFMLKGVGKDLLVRGVSLRVEDGALEALAKIGFDPDFGARPMRRAIQDKVENKLAELVLGGKLQRRDTVVIGEGAEIRVERG